MKLLRPDKWPEKIVPRCAVDLVELSFYRQTISEHLEPERLYSGQCGDKRAADFCPVDDLSVQLLAHHIEAETSHIPRRAVVVHGYKEPIGPKKANHGSGEGREPLCNIGEMARCGNVKVV